MTDPLTILLACAALAAFAMALVFGLRGSRGLQHGLLAGGLFLCGLECLLLAASAAALLPEHTLLLQKLRLVVTAAIPGTWFLFSLVYARANYGEFLRRWRIPLVGIVLLPPAVVVAGWGTLVLAVNPEEGRAYWTMTPGAPALLLATICIVSAVLIMAGLERTLREARGVVRWRIKFAIGAVLVLFASRIYVDGQVLVQRVMDPALSPLLASGLIGACALLLASLRRTRQGTLDLYVSTDMMFGSVAAVLVAAYLVSIGLLAGTWSSDETYGPRWLGSALAIAALLAMVLILLSDRVRVTMRRFMTRHFRRPSFDYRQLWRLFAERTGHAMSQEELARSVTNLVAETFEALSVSLWLVDEERVLCLVASTTRTAPAPAGSARTVVPGEVEREWARMTEPVDLDRASAAWTEFIRGWTPSQFEEGGHRYAMPLRADGIVCGMLTLGDRVHGLPMSAEELDLFQTLAEQTASRIMSLRTSERLLVAKQMEAFQMMSAFLVHDLKNTVSGLSLTLQNLKSYFDDPSFRKDAEQSIAAGVQKMKEIIRRLADLRRSLDLHPEVVELNRWTEDALARLDPSLSRVVTWRRGPGCHVRLDGDHLLGVLENLLLNAREASPAGSPVEVRIDAVDGAACLRVIDQGCGMSPEFVSGRLFRPFQTTKKEGMGIGLFQARLVVEAHGGRLDVESEPGKGSVFTVRLPKEEVAHEAVSSPC